jgi:iduronate 2-sulfatase
MASPDAITLPQAFRQAGWRTEALGKVMHTGHGNHEDVDSWSVPHWRPGGSAYASDALQRIRTIESERLPNVPATADGPPVENVDLPDHAFSDGRIADEAIRRLRAARTGSREPFFLAVGFLKPHLPFSAPKRFWDLYDRAAFSLPELTSPPSGAPAYARTTWGELRAYRGMPDVGPLTADQQRELIHGYHATVSFMDAQVGRLLDALEGSGLAGNTIVVLWGDHGWHLGDHGQWAKHTNYEEATRIPLLVRAPGITRPGTHTDALVETVDLYPTLVELAGLPAPRGPQPIEGRSFAATLRDAAIPTKPAVFHAYPRTRPGDGQIIGRAVRTAVHRLVEWKKPGAASETADLELYDYVDDPHETRNHAADRPALVASLRALLAAQPEAIPQITVGVASKSGVSPPRKQPSSK